MADHMIPISICLFSKIFDVVCIPYITARGVLDFHMFTWKASRNVKIYKIKIFNSSYIPLKNKVMSHQGQLWYNVLNDLFEKKSRHGYHT